MGRWPTIRSGPAMSSPSSLHWHPPKASRQTFEGDVLPAGDETGLQLVLACDLGLAPQSGGDFEGDLGFDLGVEGSGSAPWQRRPLLKASIDCCTGQTRWRIPAGSGQGEHTTRTGVPYTPCPGVCRPSPGRIVRVTRPGVQVGPDQRLVPELLSPGRAPIGAACPRGTRAIADRPSPCSCRGMPTSWARRRVDDRLPDGVGRPVGAGPGPTGGENLVRPTTRKTS